MKGFQSIEEHPNHFVMHHSDGHQLHVAKAGLSKRTLQHIQKFAEGGEVQPQPGYGVSTTNTLDKSKTDAFKTAFNQEQSQRQSNPKLEQSKAKNYANGGGISLGLEEVPDPTAALSPNNNQYSLSPPVPIPPSPTQIDDESQPSGLDYIKSIKSSIANNANDLYHTVNNTSLGHALLTGTVPKAIEPQTQEKTTRSNYIPTSQAQGVVPASDTQEIENAAPPGILDMSRIYGAQEKSLRHQGDIQAELGEQESGIYENEAKNLKSTLDAFQSTHQKLFQEAQNVVDDMKNNHINPNHYFENKSTFGQVSTAIGLMLGGIGGALTHQENPALKFLNSQIERDLNAQINEKNSVLNGYRNLLGDNVDAMKMASATQKLRYASLISQAASKSQSAMAKEIANSQALQLQQNANWQMAQIGAKRTLYGISSQGKPIHPATMNAILPYLDPKEAENIRERYVPNAMGLANSKQDAETLKKQDVNSTELIKTLGQLKHISDQAGTLGTWNPQQYQQAKYLAGRAQDLYRQTQGEGVFRQGEAQFIQSLVPNNPTSLLASTFKSPKFAKAIEDMESSRINLYKTYGLNVQPILGMQATVNPNIPASFKRASTHK